MDLDRFLRMKICQPAKAEPQWSTGLFCLLQVLMKTLQRSNREILGRHLERLAHHLPLARAITVQRNQQRRRTRGGNVNVVRSEERRVGKECRWRWVQE